MKAIILRSKHLGAVGVNYGNHHNIDTASTAADGTSFLGSSRGLDLDTLFSSLHLPPSSRYLPYTVLFALVLPTRPNVDKREKAK